MIEVFIQDKSLLLHADDTDCWSEITPLPGWSVETIEDVLAAVFEEDFDRYPSVAFATEMLYCENEPAIIPYAILLSGTPEQILNDAKEAVSHLAKVKVGHLDLNETIDLCQKLFDMGFKLRLDFNQEWSVSDALALSHHFPKNRFEYFEEPTKELEIFCELTTQRLAVDETIYTCDFWHLPNISSIILKPPQWGGVGDCLEIAQRAHRQGKQIVLSNTFKTRVGLQSLLHFAKLLKEPIAPIGLGFLELPDEKPNLERIGVVSFEPAIK